MANQNTRSLRWRDLTETICCRFKQRLQLETGPPLYMVIRATQRSSRLQRKGSTFISHLSYSATRISVPL